MEDQMLHTDDLQELEEVFRQVFRKKTQEWGKYVEKGISGSQAMILEKLEAGGPQKVADLAELLHITPGAVTGLCDKLVSGGYAKRRRAEDDRRVVYVEISRKGLETLTEVRQLRREIVDKFYGGLSKEDVRHLIRIYKNVLYHLKKEEE
jgi:DNA-binding MarR family transcriptional regulator